MSQTPYILGQVVARGGMAEVYRGLHVGQDGFRRLVAIKRILPHHSQNAEFTEMFKDEAHIGQRLQHANIVKVEGFDIIEGSASIVMEFIDGSDLRSVLSAIEGQKMGPGAKSYMPNALCIFVIAEAARGLHYAHTRHDDITNRPLNIVHRDISPQNLLISWEGEVKITDFGIAAADRDFKQTETKAGIVKGKYSYMSPEQISGKKCDAKTDVFALSVVLWEMLAMRRLFTSDNEIEVIEMVRHCKIPARLRDLNPNVSEELEAIVMRGLTKDPRKRYDSMDHLEKTLRAYLAKTYPTTSGTDLSSFMKGLLSEKRELAQEEMRKILTSTQLPAAAPASNVHKSRELTMDDTSSGNTAFTIGKTRTGYNQSLQTTRTPNQTNQRPIQKHPPHSFRASQTFPPRSRNQPKAGGPDNTTIFFAIAAMILAIAGGLMFKNYKNAAKQALTLSLRTSPGAVRIKLNDRDYAGGRYLTSPINLKLDPGLNSIEVLRPGYSPQKMLLNTSDGMPHKPPFLRLQPSSIFAPVRINYRGTENVVITVNDGFFKAQMTSPQSAEQIPDFVAGTPSKIVVLGAEKKILFTCDFVPTLTNPGRPMIITINGVTKSCDIPKPVNGGRP